eukprot:SAG11_NODE_577_length_8382_cov_36.300374_3_plen_54_part_00
MLEGFSLGIFPRDFVTFKGCRKLKCFFMRTGIAFYAFFCFCLGGGLKSSLPNY